jgi:peroxiredoxin Q/BCP
MGEWIAEGQAAPELGLQDDAGKTVRLADFRGRPVVLYFYPKDDTPGCTREACAFRDRRDEVARRGAAVVGVSPDGVESHARFRDKHGLNFPLLADPAHRVAEAYGAWRQKTLYGRKSIGIQRSTFLIDGQGVVRRVWRKVQVDGHDSEVLAALEQLAGRSTA